MNRVIHQQQPSGDVGWRWRNSLAAKRSSQALGAAVLSLGLFTAVAPVGATVHGATAGTYEEGVALGHRNAGILFDRLKLRTVDTQGCEAIGRLEAALVRVVSSVRPPRGSSDALVRGFYRGYQEEIREGLQTVRRGCGPLRRSSGIFLGNYFGALTCSAAAQSTAIELVPITESWASEDGLGLQECLDAGREFLWSCEESFGRGAEGFESLVAQACAQSGDER